MELSQSEPTYQLMGGSILSFHGKFDTPKIRKILKARCFTCLRYTLFPLELGPVSMVIRALVFSIKVSFGTNWVTHSSWRGCLVDVCIGKGYDDDLFGYIRVNKVNRKIKMRSLINTYLPPLTSKIASEVICGHT